MMEVAIGVDIGGTNTRFGIIDRSGKILAENCFSTTNGFSTFDNFFKTLHEKIEESVSGLQGIEIKGIGIGAPNGNYYSGIIENAPNMPWKGNLDIIEKCKQHFSFPSLLTNDANAAAVGEMIYGSAKGMKNFIVITLGTGLGSGIVVNGELLLGEDSFAGEMGHTIVEKDGRHCGCGLQGCLETYVSATGIKRTVLELISFYNIPNAFSGIPYDKITAKLIADEAKKGDRIALEAFEYTGRILGQKIAEAIAYFSPQAIFLFGGLANAGDILFNPVIFHTEKNTLHNFKNKVKILPSGVSESAAAILGAAAMVWKMS